jgi:hypothetical protein
MSRLGAKTSASIVALALLLPGGAVLAREVDGDDRLLTQFVKDGEVVTRGWLEGRSVFEGWDDGDRAALGSLLAFTFASDFEVGLAFAGLWVDPDRGDSQEGFSDTQVFGKVRLIEKPVVLSVGTVISIPTGDEDEGLGTGEVDMEFFGAIRRAWRPMTLVANAGFRVNQDPDVRLLPGGFPSDSPGGEIEGEISGVLGAGLIFLQGERWSYQVELSFESKRYEGHDSDLRFTPGVFFRTARTSLRAGVSIGLSDGAPDYSLLGSAVFRF